MSSFADDLKRRIRSEFQKLSNSQKKLAEFILQNYEEAAFMTSSRIARKVGLSPSSVVRFAAALGYEGFPQFQKALQQILRENLTTVTRLQKIPSKYPARDSILKQVLQNDISNIQHALDGIPERDFDEAVRRIFQSETVYIAGLRSAYCLAFFLGFSLRFFLKDVFIIQPGIGDLPEQMRGFSRKDVLIGISFQRYTKDTVEIVRRAKARGLYVIALTDRPLSPVAQNADISFILKTELSSFVESFTAPLSLINALVTAIALHQKSRTLRALSSLERLWEEFEIYHK